MALNLTDKQLGRSALGALVSVRMCLWFGSFDRLRKRLRLSEEGQGGNVDDSKRVARAVEAVGDAWPFSGNCLVKAAAAVRLLRRHGLPGNLCIGVVKEPGRAFEAHAWVECEGEVLIGEDDLDRFTPLEMVGRRSATSND